MLCAMTLSTFAQDAFAGADITIRFVNKKIYYPGNSPSEPMLIQVSIVNNGNNSVRFKLADDHFFSFDFSLINTKNIQLEKNELWLRRRTTNQHIYFREISLEPGESYSFIENVKDYVKITQPGLYILEGSFFPELKRLPDYSENHTRSNKLTVEVKPSPSAAATKVLSISPDTAEILQAQALPPDQVIQYILTSRQKSLWEQFFLYFDLERMIVRDPTRSKRFRSESENGRLLMIENYKSELRQEKTDKDISTVPVEFKIEKTTYTDSEGIVTVLEWFDYRTFREKKRYTYYLSSHDGIWYVYDYTVDNLGTE